MNIFIFGLGQSAKAHIKSLLSFSTVSTIVIFTNYPVKTNSGRIICASRNNVNSVAKDYFPDLILIASSTSSHLTDFELIRHFEVPIIFEKPVSSSLKDTHIILHSSKNLIGPYVFFQRRLSPEFQSLLALSRSSALGKPSSVLCHLSKYKSRNGFGYLSHYGIHYIDLFFRLLNVQEYNLSSFINDIPGTEKIASISGTLNMNIHFSILLDCCSRYSCGSSIVFQFENASITVADHQVSIVSDQEIVDEYNKLIATNKNIYFQDSTNMALYENFWVYFLSKAETNHLPNLIPTLNESFEVEAFIDRCYS